MSQPTAETRLGNRLEFLDALRGIACSAVVVEHTFFYVSPRFLDWSQRVFDFGQFGVVTFFFISGFIIPVTVERSASLQSFWINRACRLFPVYWLSLLFITMLYFAGKGDLPFRHHLAASLAVNVTMLQSFVRVPDAIPAYWTLGMELVFYFLCSVLFAAKWLAHPARCAWLAAAGLLALVLTAGLIFHRSIPAGRVGLIVVALVGTVYYGVHAGRVKPSELLKLLPFTLAVLLTGFWFRFQLYPADPSDASEFRTIATTWVLASLLFLGGFLLRGREFPRWLLWLGRISYSLYLMQGLVLIALPRLTNPALIVAVNFVGSVGLAWLVNIFVERPATAFLKAWVKARALRPS
jgi:peptidoglycan/LPS O-acetylase OafA/YrhL